MSAEARLREKLMFALEPIRLDIINESEMHAGHRSSPGTGESHFRILIVSEAFAGKSRVDRHRMVNDILVRMSDAAFMRSPYRRSLRANVCQVDIFEG